MSLPDDVDSSPDDERRALLELLLAEQECEPADQEEEGFALSSAQRRLWLLDQLQPGNPAYLLPSGLRLKGVVDRGVLHSCLTEIVRRHEALRTSFRLAADGEPVQVIAPPAAPDLPVADLGALPAGRREPEAARLARTEVHRPFDLSRGPMLRGLVLCLDAGRAPGAAMEHALFLTLHHIAGDGWSVGVLIRELVQLYAAFVQGRPSPLPELPVQYLDYAAWQSERLAGPELERQLAYWRQALAGAPPLLDLPADRPRPPVQSGRGGRARLLLPRALQERLTALGHGANATLFMTLYAGAAALLARLAGVDDLVLGAPLANRSRAETEPLIGLLANTVALRLDLRGDPSVRELLVRARAVVLGAFAHQDLPFDRLVEELAPQRNLSYAPVFQTAFALQNARSTIEGTALTLPGLEATVLAAPRHSAKFDLGLSLIEARLGLAATALYSTDLFDAPRMGRLLLQYETLLAAAAAEPDRRLSALPLLTAAERHQLLVEWNAAAERYRPEGFAHLLFEDQVRRDPGAVAVIAQTADGSWERVTYAELDRRAEQVAERLLAHGIGRSATGGPPRIGLCADRSAAQIAALLGIWKAGGVYLPLDPGLPAPRLAYLAADAAPAVILAQAGTEALFVKLSVPLLPLAAEGSAGTSPDRRLALDDPAYVLYTSGSTGEPKGVVVPHRALGNRLQYLKAVELAPGDVFLHKAAVGFDVTLTEILGPLAAGATVAVAPPGSERDGAEVIRRIAELGVTHASFTAAALTAALADPGFVHCRSLRTVLAGAEVIPPELALQVMALLGADFKNRYGPTEATVSVTEWRCSAADAGRPLPIGRPYAGAEIFLLDRRLRPVPAGVPGEICIGGPCLAQGYLARPAVTAASFVPHPFSQVPGARLYRTGDLGRFREDGAIDFLGRRDQQVQIRGLRVELGEIEAVLARAPGVREAAVVQREGPVATAAAGSLLGCVVLRPGVDPTGPTVPGLLAFLQARLPAPMVPAALLVLPAFPLTPTGKVDRRALARLGPAPGGAPTEEGRAEETFTSVEEVVAAVWAEVLRLPAGDAGLHRGSDFFALGGHSLTAAQVAARLRAACGVELPLRTLFEAPTLAALAAAVSAGRRLDGEAEAPPIRRLPRGPESTFPLSFAQERLWFLEQLDPGSPTYHIAAALRLTGSLNLAALAAALGGVVERHEALRTGFGEAEGRPVQRVYSAGTWSGHSAGTLLIHSAGTWLGQSAGAWALPVWDLTALPPAGREAEMRRLARAEGRRPFDLARGPLLRAAAARLSPEEHAVFLTLHHIAADGWSVDLLVRELPVLYGAALAGVRLALPELPVQYADYAVWQRAWLAGETLERQLAFWREALAGAPPVLALPADRPRPAVRSGRGVTAPVELPAGAAEKLQGLARREGASLFMVLLAGWAAVLGRLCGIDDVPVGTAVANRSRPEIEGLIGFFVNTLVLRSDLAGDPAGTTLLSRVRRAALDAFAYQDLPLERLVEELAPERDLSRTPLFQAAFAFQGARSGAPPAGLPGVSLQRIEGAAEVAKFDLTLALGAGPRELGGTLQGSRDLFDPATVRRLAGHVATLLGALADDPEAPLSALSLLTAAEALQLLEWSRGPLAPVSADEVAALSIPEIVAGHAARTPGALAVEFQGEKITYAELDRRARRLAGRLREIGVGPEVRVGLCVALPAERVVAALAILQAGGAYVPLDPAHPAERLAFLLRDSGARVVVTETALADRLPADLPKLCVDRPEDVDGPQWTGPLGTDLEGLAIVLYTSGSTGMPKGVALPHRAVVRRLCGVSWMRFGPTEAMAQASNVAFDAATVEIWGALLHGAPLLPIAREVALSPPELAEELRRRGVRSAVLATALCHQVARAVPDAFASLGQLLIGGEAADPAPLRALLAAGPPGALYNGYGPAEVTTLATCERVEEVPAGAISVPIGRPIDGAEALLVDRWGALAPLGAVGELHLGGSGLARGYLDRPALTAERFVPHPWSPEPGARLYRSGDLACRLPDGRLEFAGRSDAQVKIRGFRVEPGEVEALLALHPAVREAVVGLEEALAATVTADRRLVAWVVPAGDIPPTPVALRSHLTAALPPFMVPAAFVLLPALPLTPNGKVDRRALPTPGEADLAGPEGEGEGRATVAPRTPLEEILAGMWAELLGRERIGIHDDFFQLGGHSLLATRLISRVRTVFQVDLPLRRLFESPTVESLAAAIVEAESPPGRSEKVARALLRLRDREDSR